LSSDSSGWVGHRLSPEERHDWRLMLAVGGAVLVLLAYFLPMFPMRIIKGTTRFSGGTVVEKDFPVLISGQHFAQGNHPTKETLQDIQIIVGPVMGHNGSGWGWLVQVMARGELGAFLSYFVCLLWPILTAACILSMFGLALWNKGGLREPLIPLGIDLALLAPVALALAWFHQFDFSTKLLAMQSAALAPRLGFWLALLGTLAMPIAVWDLRRATRREIINWWALVFVAALAIWLLVRFKPFPFLDIWNFVLDGIGVTLRISLTSFGFILLVSLFGGLGRISRSKIIHGIASLYVELVRGIPLLVQLLFIWFALPQVFDVVGTALTSLSPSLESAGLWLTELRLDPFTAAVMGLTVCYGAYGSEIFRAGITSIHHGQMEAARSLGMTYVQAMYYVILPQAIRVILPPVGNDFVALLKDSSLVSVLAVSDLTRRGREYMAVTFLSFDTWILVALCYLVLTLFSSRVVEFIESKSKFER
jgi:polar amino acid transport system permease protein